MKRKSVTAIRVISLLLVICSAMMCLTACGKEVTVKISDAGVTTEVVAKTNMTVQEILDEAGIVLGEKDETEPAAEKELEDATEITVMRYAKVTVKNDKVEKTVELVGGTVEDAVLEAGFLLDDTLAPDIDKDTYLEDGMVITLKEAVEVTLTADGEKNNIKTFATTVKDFLEEQGITLDEDDEVSPKPEDAIKEGTKIVVKRVEYKEEVRKESIAFETEEQQSSSLSAGQSQVAQEGVNGEKEVTYKVKYVDGKEDSKEKLSEKVTKEPVKKIVTVGTKTETPQQTNGGQSDQGGTQSGGKQVVSKQAVYDCDGSGHGYYVITYSDGTVEYEVF